MTDFLATAPAPPPGFALAPHRSNERVGWIAYESEDGEVTLYLWPTGRVTAADEAGWHSVDFGSLAEAAEACGR